MKKLLYSTAFVGGLFSQIFSASAHEFLDDKNNSFIDSQLFNIETLQKLKLSENKKIFQIAQNCKPSVGGSPLNNDDGSWNWNTIIELGGWALILQICNESLENRDACIQVLEKMGIIKKDSDGRIIVPKESDPPVNGSQGCPIDPKALEKLIGLQFKSIDSYSYRIV